MADKQKSWKAWLRELWWIALLGLLVHAFWAARLQQPSYFDAYYYTTNGQRLAQGHGFTEEIIWQYLDQPQGLPAPSHTYWMPLTSMMAAAGYALGGSFRAAQVPFWLLAGLLPLLAYAISWQLGGKRGQARTAALLTMAGGYYAAYWAQPTTFAPFAWAGGGCLLALAVARRKGAAGGARRQEWPWWLLAGLGAGLAHLTRADGLLIAAVAGLTWLLQARETWRGRRALPWAAAGLLAAGYLAVMGPWFYHTWRVTGQPMSTVGAQTLFLTDYDDLFAYGRQFDWRHYMAWGWANILRSKLAALWLALQTYVAVIGLLIFGFFAAAAWLAARGERRRFLQAPACYGAILFVAMSLIFTFPGQRGSLLHSSTALWPWSMALAAAGIEQSIGWVAARRRRWREQSALSFFSVAFVLLAFALTPVVALGQPLRVEEAAIYSEMATLMPPGAVVMASDPPGLHYHSGLPAVVTPNEGPEGMLAAARQFGATYLLLDKGHPQPLAAVYEGSDPLTPPLVHDFGNGIRLYRLDGAQESGR